MEITGGRGVDCLVEVGGADMIARSFGSVRVGGRIGLIGDHPRVGSRYVDH